MTRFVVSLAAMACVAALASTAPPQPVVRYSASVLAADPKLEILLPATGELPLMLRSDGRGSFTLPVFQYLGDSWKYPDNPADGDVYGFTHTTVVRYHLIAPGTNWTDSVTVTGYANDADVYRAPPTEGFGWRMLNRYETLELLETDTIDLHNFERNGVSYHTQFNSLANDHELLVEGVRLSETPEPATLVLGGIGLAGVIGMRMRRRVK